MEDNPTNRNNSNQIQDSLHYRTMDMYSYSCIPVKSILYKLWTVGLCLSVIWSYHTVHGQDTMAIQHSGYNHHEHTHSVSSNHNSHLHCSKHCSSMIGKLEQRIHHRIREMEHRLDRRHQEQMKANNKTAQIDHAEKLMHHVLEELQVGTVGGRREGKVVYGEGRGEGGVKERREEQMRANNKTAQMF